MIESDVCELLSVDIMSIIVNTLTDGQTNQEAVQLGTDLLLFTIRLINNVGHKTKLTNLVSRETRGHSPLQHHKSQTDYFLL